MLESMGVPRIRGQSVVEKVRPDGVWVGDGWYTRNIGSLGNKQKALYGKPRVASAARVAFLERAAKFDLRVEGLDGLVRGEPTKLYHGTVASFSKFDLSKSRDELVEQFYGKGIFLTPSLRVAWKYAEANRNIGFPPSIIQDLKRVDSVAGIFLELLVKQGDGAWDLEKRP